MAELWFYTTEGKQMDPVSIKELVRLVGDGTLKPTDMVWKEGMARWIRASSVRELFPDPGSALDPYFTSAASTAPQAQLAEPVPTAVAVPVRKDTEEPQPRKSRPLAESEEVEPRRPPRRRPEAPRGGSNVSLIVFLLLGVGALMICLVGGVALVIFGFNPAEPNIDPNGFVKDGTTYTVQLRNDSNESRTFQMRKGTRYHITVKTNVKTVDVDLHITNRGVEVASDDGPAADCDLHFTPDRDGQYRLELRNLDHFQTVQSTVLIKEEPLAKVDPIKEQPKEQPLPKDVREGNGIIDNVSPLPAGKELVLKFRARGGHASRVTASVVNPKAAPPGVNVRVEKQDNTLIASTNAPGMTASVNFSVPTTEFINVRIRNESKVTVKLQVFHDVSP